MHRLVAALALALTLLPTAALSFQPVSIETHADAAVQIAESMLETEGCEAAFQKAYSPRWKRPARQIADDLFIVVVDVPPEAGKNVAGVTVPPIAPRIIALSRFWVLMRNPISTGDTIVHEMVHLLDWSYLGEDWWRENSVHKKEVRAEDISEACLKAFFEKYPEMQVD